MASDRYLQSLRHLGSGWYKKDILHQPCLRDMARPILVWWCYDDRAGQGATAVAGVRRTNKTADIGCPTSLTSVLCLLCRCLLSTPLVFAALVPGYVSFIRCESWPEERITLFDFCRRYPYP